MITNEDDDSGLWYAISFGALLVLAAAIRFRALGTTLFEDEVWVANLVRHGGWHPHSYSTPPLFYAIGRAWAWVRGTTDGALREPAAFFGVALCAVPLFAPLPRLSRFLWGALLAFSSPLIFYSERTKQYTLEAFVAAVLIVLFLRLRESRSRLTTFVFFAVAAGAVMSLYAPIFLLAAMAVVSIRRPRLVAGFVFLAALCGFAYFGWLKPGPESIRLHGDMTGYFTASGRWVTSPSLFITNSLHWMGQSLNLVRFWWLAAGILVLVWLMRERNVILPLLAILPPVAVAAASVFRLYPYGEVRLMIFCFPALFLLIAVSLAEAARRVPALTLLLAPFVLMGVSRDVYNDTYMHIDDLRPMYAMIASGHAKSEAVYADPSFAAPLIYYYPWIAIDVRSGPTLTTAGPGWYVHRTATFRAAGERTTLRIGDVTAVHKP